MSDEKKEEVKPLHVKATVVVTYQCPSCGVEVGAPDELELTAEKARGEVKADNGKCKHCEQPVYQNKLVASFL